MKYYSPDFSLGFSSLTNNDLNSYLFLRISFEDKFEIIWPVLVLKEGEVVAVGDVLGIKK